MKEHLVHWLVHTIAAHWCTLVHSYTPLVQPHNHQFSLGLNLRRRFYKLNIPTIVNQLLNVLFSQTKTMVIGIFVLFCTATIYSA